MKRSKRISELYKERFKDLEIAPPEDVWENITASLPGKKRKTRILPFWYKIAGIAAVLAVLFLLFNGPFSRNEPAKVTSEPNSTIPGSKEDNQENLLPELISEDEELVKTSGSKKPKSNGMMNLHQGIHQQIATLADDTVENKEVEAFFTGLHHHPKIKSGSTLRYTLPNLPNRPELGANMNAPQKENQGITDLAALKQNPTGSVHENDIVAHSSLADRFSVTPTAAAIYFDNLGSGNSLDNQFARKESTGEITMAYGINVAYRLSEKIKVRTGFSQIELSHRTQGMSLASMAKTTAVDNSQVRTTLAAPANGYLHQRMDFIEIPLEIEYALVQDKIGVNLIGGISTLFLDGNAISLSSPISTTDLGEAKNLNNTSFSANIGVGLDYKILPQIRLKLEPIFKYQLNTFNSISGFNPYYFGIYSGISYKF